MIGKSDRSHPSASTSLSSLCAIFPEKRETELHNNSEPCSAYVTQQFRALLSLCLFQTQPIYSATHPNRPCKGNKYKSRSTLACPAIDNVNLTIS